MVADVTQHLQDRGQSHVGVSAVRLRPLATKEIESHGGKQHSRHLRGELLAVNLSCQKRADPEGIETSAGSDAYSFGSEVGLRIRRELEPLVRDVMVNERRPGGVLHPTDRVHGY